MSYELRNPIVCDTKGVLRDLSLEYARPPFLCASVLKKTPHNLPTNSLSLVVLS